MSLDVWTAADVLTVFYGPFQLSYTPSAALQIEPFRTTPDSTDLKRIAMFRHEARTGGLDGRGRHCSYVVTARDSLACREDCWCLNG